MSEWINIKDQLPDHGILVSCKLGNRRVIEKLKCIHGLWYTSDFKPYIWNEPTHWLRD